MEWYHSEGVVWVSKKGREWGLVIRPRKDAWVLTAYGSRTLLAGPFDTLDAAKVAYLMHVPHTGE